MTMFLNSNKKPYITASRKKQRPTLWQCNQLCSGKTTKLDANKLISRLQHEIKSMGNFRYLNRTSKLLGQGWKNYIPQFQNKQHGHMTMVGEPRNLRSIPSDTFQSSDTNEWELAMKGASGYFKCKMMQMV